LGRRWRSSFFVKLCVFQRLGEVIVHARVKTALAVALESVGRHSDDQRSGAVASLFAL
jgi:hypothetical protein